MSTKELEVKRLADWYLNHAQPFLLKHLPDKVAEFDKDLEVLRQVEAAIEKPMAACFLGAAAVGKSTLINSLVGGGEIVVPAGGIGPLTAQAMKVRFHEEPYFEVQYHALGNLWQLVFALEQAHKHELRDQGQKTTADLLLENPELVEKEDAAAITQIVTEDASRLAKIQDFRKQAQLMVTGGQDNRTDLPYLVDSLREAGGMKRVWKTTCRPEDAERIRELQLVLEMAKQNQGRVYSASAGKADFIKAIENHASGFLAPLIRDLTLYWNSEILRDGVELVDLPGIGIAGDVYREVTRRYIRDSAEAVVLVVDRAGITESAADLLYKSEFLSRLIYSADDPKGNPVLMVAVVKIDDVAGERYAKDQNKRKREHFADVCEAMDAFIRSHIRPQLEAAWSTDGVVTPVQRQVIDNVIATLQVHPVSAIEYRKFKRDDDDDRSFIKSEEESNIPRLKEQLAALAATRKHERLARLEQKKSDLCEHIAKTLLLIEAQWQQQDRAVEEAEKLRADLKVFMQPLREELSVRQGQYRAFLKKTVPSRIQDLVSAASARAQLDIAKYLMRIGTAHWATLRASVRRGGRFSGATYIDLPREFALRFEEPIAEAWSKEILKDIRKETKDYADDCLALVEQVVAWAKNQGARVQPRLVEAQYDAIKVDAKKLQGVGREMVNELRDEAKNQLIETIEGPIRARCTKFVERHDDIGPGVRDRILGLYRELPTEIADAATKPAANILTRLFREVEKEISVAFEEHQDPLASAAEAIVSSQEEYLKRSDAQKRKGVLRDVGTVMAESPFPIASPAEAVCEARQ